MSLVGLGGSVVLGREHGMGEPRGSIGWASRYGDQEISQFRGADLIAERWGITREEMEALALESHRRAIDAIDAGRFESELVKWDGIAVDEGPRRHSDPAKMASLAPVREGGFATAALASQISDGAAAVVLASGEAVAQHRLTPLVRISAMSVAGSDPVEMLTGPIPATRMLLKRAGLSAGDIGTWEVNEAFASVVLAWQREFGVDLAQVNPDGGAMALGHPVGASGARILATLSHRMQREGHKRGAQVMCEGGGTANATLLELP
jgi:acetyl-CoA C-acetyltransferase